MKDDRIKKQGKKAAKAPTANMFAVDKGPALETIPLEARALVTIGEGHPFWKKGKLSGEWEGAIVRIRPPSLATEEQLSELERLLKKHGVAKVRFESRAQADALPDDEAPAICVLHTNQREVVLEMAKKSKRPQALFDALEGYMQKAGL